MRKMMIVSAMALMLSTAAMAQQTDQQNGPRFDRTEMIQNRTKAMAEKYGLNEEQQNKLLELNKEYPMAMPMMGPRPGRQGMGMRPGGPRGNGNGQMGERPQRPQGQMGQGGPGRGRGPRMMDPETMKKYDEAVKVIMTQEQYSKYEADRKEQIERMNQFRNRPQNNQQ